MMLKRLKVTHVKIFLQAESSTCFCGEVPDSRKWLFKEKFQAKFWGVLKHLNTTAVNFLC